MILSYNDALHNHTQYPAPALFVISNGATVFISCNRPRSDANCWNVENFVSMLNCCCRLLGSGQVTISNFNITDYRKLPRCQAPTSCHSMKNMSLETMILLKKWFSFVILICHDKEVQIGSFLKMNLNKTIIKNNLDFFPLNYRR